MFQKHALATASALCLIATSCIFVVNADEDDINWHSSGKVTKGSRVEATEPRTVGAFQRIQVGGPIDVEVEIVGDASSAPELVARTDDNLISMLRTDVKGGTLVVRWDESEHGIEPRVQPLVRVKVPSLEGVSLTGSGDATIRGLKSGSFRADVTGSGNVTLKGKVERVTAAVSGSGDVDAFGLEAVEARATVSGSGDVHVTASEHVDAAVSGSGDVVYRGNPKQVERSIAGSGSVSPDSGP